MKKSLLCLIGILIAFTAKSQYVEGDYGIFHETIAVNDSVVDTIYQGTVPDIEKVNLLILGAIDTSVSSVDSFYVAGQDDWVGNGDTIKKVDTAIYSDTAIYAMNGGDSTWVRIDADSAFIAYIKTGSTVIDSTSVTTDKVVVSDTVKISNTYDGNYHLIYDNNDGSLVLEGGDTGNDRIEIGGDEGESIELYSNVVVQVNGTKFTQSKTTGSYYTGTSDPTNNTFRSNYDGILSATQFKSTNTLIDSNKVLADSGFFDEIFIDTTTAIKGKFDTIVVGDSIITGTITLKEAVQAETFDSINTTNLSVSGVFNHDYYHAAAYLDEDSTITTSLTTSWIFLGSGSNNKFTNIVADGFSQDGDTLTFSQDVGDARDSVKMCISYSCVSSSSDNNKNIFIGIFIKHTGGSYVEYVPVTSSTPTIASGTYYAGPTCSTMPVWLQDGDKIQIRAKCGATTTTLSTKYFKINLGEK